ncbi:MAG: rod shape-determining protein MreD [Clostridia bacterium]|nr:rod shape-determining protein MreD [Clostridia bacterium]
MKKPNEYKYYDTFIYILLLIIAFFLQSTSVVFTQNIPSPSLVLALVIVVSLFENYWYSALFGLICGILVDSVNANGSGLYALVFMLTGVICSLVLNSFFQKNFASFAVISVPAILINELLDVINKCGFTNGFFALFIKFYILVALYTFAVAFLLYLLFYFRIKRDEKYKKPKGIIKPKK